MGKALLNRFSGLYVLSTCGVDTGDVSALMATTRRMSWKSKVLVAGIMLLRNQRSSLFVHNDSLDSENSAQSRQSQHQSFAAQVSLTADFPDVSRVLGRKRRHLIAPLLTWHARLGHIGDVPLRLLLKNSPQSPNSVLDPDSADNSICCSVCLQSKAQQRTGKGISIPRSLVLFERVYADVAGPMPVLTLGGSKYYVVFVEDSTQFGKVFVIKKRSDVLQCWIDYRRRKLAMGFSILMLSGEYGTSRARLAVSRGR